MWILNIAVIKVQYLHADTKRLEPLKLRFVRYGKNLSLKPLCAEMDLAVPLSKTLTAPRIKVNMSVLCPIY